MYWMRSSSAFEKLAGLPSKSNACALMVGLPLFQAVPVSVAPLKFR